MIVGMNIESVVATIDPRRLLLADVQSPSGAAMVSLANMAEGCRAKNNCYNSAETVSRHLRKNAVKSRLMGLIFDTGEHWASTIIIDNTEYVVDFTARQFAPNETLEESIPFPMVMERNSWIETIQGWVDARWGQSLRDIECLV